MKILRSVFLVVMLLVALLAVVDTAYGIPQCGYLDANGKWHRDDAGYAAWVYALCTTQSITLAQFNAGCHTSYQLPPLQGITPCTITE